MSEVEFRDLVLVEGNPGGSRFAIRLCQLHAPPGETEIPGSRHTDDASGCQVRPTEPQNHCHSALMSGRLLAASTKLAEKYRSGGHLRIHMWLF